MNEQYDREDQSTENAAALAAIDRKIQSIEKWIEDFRRMKELVPQQTQALDALRLTRRVISNIEAGNDFVLQEHEMEQIESAPTLIESNLSVPVTLQMDESPSGELADLSYPKAIRRILEQAGNRLTVDQVVQRLKEGGKVIEGENENQVVSGKLSRNKKQFFCEKVGVDFLWGLRKWEKEAEFSEAIREGAEEDSDKSSFNDALDAILNKGRE